MIRLLMLVAAVVATLAIFATTRPGRALRKRIGLRDTVPGAASSEDVAFLLTACGGDRRELTRRVEAERERFPELSEGQHYRRAIRRVFLERERSDARESRLDGEG